MWFPISHILVPEGNVEEISESLTLAVASCIVTHNSIANTLFGWSVVVVTYSVLGEQFFNMLGTFHACSLMSC